MVDLWVIVKTIGVVVVPKNNGGAYLLLFCKLAPVTNVRSSDGQLW